MDSPVNEFGIFDTNMLGSETDYQGEVDNTVYKQRKGAIDLGRPYEYKMCALLAQRFALDDNIKDFWLLTNMDNLGAFDDVVIYATYPNNKTHIFLIQLKHTDRAVSMVNILAESGIFSLSEYQKDYETVKTYCGKKGILQKNKISDVTFILYTNANFSINLSNKETSLSCVRTNRMFDTSKTDGNIYQFHNDSKAYDRNFLTNFYFYTSQVNESDIPEMLKQEWCPDLDKNSEVTLFLNFIHNWATRGKIQKLYKKHIRYKLYESMLSPHLMNPNILVNFKSEDVTEVLHKTLIKYNLVVIESKFEVLGVIWTSIQHVLKRIGEHLDVRNFNTELTYSETTTFLNDKSPVTKARRNKNGTISMKNIYLSLFEDNKVPLVVTFQNATERIINYALNYFQNVARNRSVILVKNCERFPMYGTITTLNALSDLPKNLINENFKRIFIHLQEKECIPLSNFFQRISSALDVNIYLKLISEQLVVGKKENFPEYYIGRTIKVPMLKDVTNIKNCLFVFNETDTFLKRLRENTIDFREYMNDLDYSLKQKEAFKYSHINIATISNQLSGQFLEVVENFHSEVISNNRQGKLRGAICFLKHHEDTDLFEILFYFGQVELLQKNLLYHDINEINLLKSRNSRINILCSNAGMGKSLTLAFFYNHSSPDEWVVHLDLVKHSSYFKKYTSTNAVDYMFDVQMKNVPKIYHRICRAMYLDRLESGKITWFIDGYDEEHSLETQAFLKEICKTNLKLWVATRPSFKYLLEKTLHVISMDLNHFTENDQKQFFERYFRSKNKQVDEEDVCKIIQYVKRTKIDETLIGIPLQIRMFADLIDEEIIDYRGDEIITIVNLYEKFVELKLKEYGRNNPKFLDITISKLSLTIFFTKEELKNILDREFTYQVEYFKEEKKGYLVIGFTEREEPLFAHRTYAEFLAARWLAKMIFIEDENATINTKYLPLVEKLFYKELALLRYFFNVVICKDLPLHLAVLNNKTETVVSLIMEKNHNVDTVDVLGRNALHVAASFGCNYDLYSKDDILGIHNIQQHFSVIYSRHDVLIQRPGNNNDFHITSSKIIDMLLNQKNLISMKDTLFNLDPVDYGLKTCSLEIVDKMYKVLPRRLDLLEEDDATYALLYYCVEYGLNNILERFCKNSERSNFRSFTKKHINHEIWLTCAAKSKNKDAVRALVQSKECGVNDKNSRSYTALHIACEVDAKEVVKELIELGANVNACMFRMIQDCTPLMVACSKGSREAVDQLLLYEDVILDSDYTSALVDAVENNFLDIARKLLEKNVRYDAKDNNRKTLLMCVCEKGCLDIFERLEKHFGRSFKKEINKVDVYQRTALMYAVQGAQELISERLLRYSLDVNQKDISGLTPLMKACHIGNLSLVIQLLENNANISCVDRSGKTACEYAFNAGHKRCVELLLRNSLVKNINILDDKNSITNLMYAVQGGLQKIVEELLDQNIDINAKDNSGKTAFIYASIAGQLHLTEKLIAVNAIDINAQDNYGKSAFIYACEMGHIKIVEKLLEIDIRLSNSTDSTGKTALVYASQNGHYNVVNSLLCNKAELDSNAFFSASKEGHIDIVKLLLQVNINILHSTDTTGKTPLLHASEKGHYEIVEYLLEVSQNIGLKIEINHKDQEGKTALIYAICNRHRNIVELLLRNHADVNTGDKHGRSPLSYASTDDLSLAELLFERNVAVEIYDNDIYQLFRTALIWNNVAIVRQLIAAGIEINGVFKYKRTPLGTVCRKGFLNIINMLLEHPKFDKSTLIEGLCIACRYGHHVVVEELLKQDVRVSDVNNKGQTPLMEACLGGHVKLVTFLLDLDRSVINIKTKRKSMTALMYACTKGFSRIVKILVANGADMEIENNKGETAFSLACLWKNDFLVKFLTDEKTAFSSNSLTEYTLRYETINID